MTKTTLTALIAGLVLGLSLGGPLGWYSSGYYLYKGLIGNMAQAIDIPDMKGK